MFRLPPPRGKVDPFGQPKAPGAPKAAPPAQPDAKADAKPDEVARVAADPKALIDLFQSFAVGDGPQATPAKEPAPAPKPAALDPQVVAMQVALFTDQALAFDRMGTSRDAMLASLSPEVRKGVEANLAAKQHEKFVASQVQMAIDLEKAGIGHDGLEAGMTGDIKKQFEAQLEERQHLATAAALARAQETMTKLSGAGHGADDFLKHLPPDERRKVEREMSVERLLANTGDGFDIKQVTDELEHLDDPKQRAAVLKEFELRSGKSLQSQIHSNLDEGNYYRTATDQLLSDDRTKAEEKIAELAKADPEKFKERKQRARVAARTLISELSKSDPDKRKIHDTLGFTDGPEDTELIRQAFREIAPEQDGLFNRLNHSLSGDNEKEAIADLDMSSDRRLVQAAAALRNAFTGFGHENDRKRMKEILEKLEPWEIDKLRDKEKYGDIIKDVQNTMHGDDAAIVNAFVEGKKDLAVGLQLAEDIAGDKMAKTNRYGGVHGDKLGGNALFQKLEKMDPAARELAVKAYNAHASQNGLPTLDNLMIDRFDTTDDNYDQDRGRALLVGDIVTAKAAQAEDAIDRKGTHIDDLEEALSDPDLAPEMATKDPDKYAAAKHRREAILKKIANYGKGTLEYQAHDEDKLAVGKDNRVALDQIMESGSVSFAIKMQRAIDDDDTEKAKKLLLNATKEELAEARRLFPHLQDGKDFDYAVRLEWGPTETIAPGLEVVDMESEAKSGNFIQMEAVLENGPRKEWPSKFRASIDRQAHDADRDDPTIKEVLGQTWAGSHYDAEIRREEQAASEGMTGEEFAFHAENTEAAGEAYGEQKEADVESFISGLKMLVNVVTMIACPYLLPLVAPLMSATAIAYKEHKLGKHYKGENADKKGLIIDIALSATGVLGEMAIGARQASKVARGIEELEAMGSEARTVGGLAREGEAVATSESQVVGGMTKAHAAADEAEVAAKEVIAVKTEVDEASEAAKAAKLASKGGDQAAGQEAQKLAETLEEKVAKVKEVAAKAAKNQALALEATKIAGDNVARGAIEGKSFDEILKGVVLSEMGLGAAKLAEHVVGGLLEKKLGGAAQGAEKTVEEGAATAAAKPWYQAEIVKQSVVGLAKTTASNPFKSEAAGKGSWDWDMWGEDMVGEVAGAAGGELHEDKQKKRIDHLADEGLEDLKFKAEMRELASGESEPGKPHTDPATELSIEAANLRAKNGGVLSVEDARAIHAKGQAQGVPASELPRPSTPEEVLLVKGMTPDELQLYKDSLNKDQQTTYQHAQRPQYQDSGHPLYDAQGAVRETMSPEMRKAVLKANIILYQDWAEGATAAKIVPDSRVPELLQGRDNWGAAKMGGDLGLVRNYEGLDASGKVTHAGLDYDNSPYTKLDADGKRVVSDASKSRVYQIEEKLDAETVGKAKVVLGHDMYADAYEEAHRLAAARAAGEEVTIPRLLELDDKGYLKNVADPRVRNHAKDPSAGTGYTASQELRDENGKQYFRPNQELTIDRFNPAGFSDGAELVTIDADGHRKVIATYRKSEMAFEIAEGLSDAEREEFSKMRLDQSKKMDDRDTDWSKL